jgi:hypothetical protein
MPNEKETAKLVTGFIYKNETDFDRAVLLMKRSFGAIERESRELSFDFTDYYSKEMGKDLKKRFISFSSPVETGRAWKIKESTNSIEEDLSISGKRSINIDPGYLTLAKLVLFSTKNYSHRIHMDKGIYAEVTLTFEKGSFRPLRHTYTDFKTEEYIRFFNEVRNTLKGNNNILKNKLP